MRQSLFAQSIVIIHIAMSQTERFIGLNTTSLTNSRVRLVCEQIRSIRGTRLLPPDIEREFTSTRRPSASELILTCHSVMAYAQSPLHVFLLASGSTFRRLSNPLPPSLLRATTLRILLSNLSGKQLIPSIYMQIRST